MWAAYFSLFLTLGAAALGDAVVITFSPGDPRIINAVTEFAYQNTENGMDNYIATVETTQNDEILGRDSE